MNDRATRVGSNREYTTDYEAALFTRRCFFLHFDFVFYGLCILMCAILYRDIGANYISVSISRFRDSKHNFWRMEIKKLFGKNYPK